jgi:hypothetical protein
VVAAASSRIGTMGVAGRSTCRITPEVMAPAKSAATWRMLRPMLAFEPPAASSIALVSMPVK